MIRTDGYLISQGVSLLRGDDQIPARRHSLAPVVTYEIEKQQFDHIENASTSIEIPLSAAFAFLPVAITLNVTLVTITMTDVHKEAVLWGFTVAFYLVGSLCAVFAFIQRGQLKEYMKGIRDNQVAPVAAKGASTSPDLTAVLDPDASAVVSNAAEEQGEEDNDAQ
jgi:hypothetical protein